ncbi:predicted protein, partial [Nematostella vectensis]
QTQIEIQKALQQDPTVYEYDSIYDDMEEKTKHAAPVLVQKDKKPKYIEQLLKSAAYRKREEERRVERQVQKEREAEGGEFQDKEEFVTSVYRQKMLERAEEEERIKQQDAIDAMNDVTKRTDMSMFYRNLLNKNVSMGGSFAADSEKTDVTDTRKKDKEKTKESCDKTTERPDSEELHLHHPRDHDRKDTGSHRQQHSESKRVETFPGSSRHEHSGSRKREHMESHRHSKHSHGQDKDQRKERIEDERRSKDGHHDLGHEDKKSTKRSEKEKPQGNAPCFEQHGEEHKHKASGDDPLLNPEVSTTSQPTSQPSQPQPYTEGEKIAKHEKCEQKREENMSKFAKRSNPETVMSARERYLQRKQARKQHVHPVTESDED